MATFRYPQTQAVLAGGATEAKQDVMISELQDIEALVTTGNASLVDIDTNTSNTASSVSSIDGKVSTEAKQDNIITELQNIDGVLDSLNARLAGNLVPETFDYLQLTYVAAGNGIGEIETVVYKTGGSGGSTVATLTLAYDGSDRLASVTRS